MAENISEMNVSVLEMLLMSNIVTWTHFFQHLKILSTTVNAWATFGQWSRFSLLCSYLERNNILLIPTDVEVQIQFMEFRNKP